MLSLNSRPKRSEDAIWRSIEGEVVIMTSVGSEIHKLNKVGGVIWELSDGTKDFGEITSSICNHFNASFEIAQADVLEFGLQLANKNLLQITEANSYGK